jgi:hypothetical protein
MTDRQKEHLRSTLKNIKNGQLFYVDNVFEAHHGDCVGADAEFHGLVREVIPQCKIWVHPMRDGKMRAYCQGDVILEPRPALDRNIDIVNASHFMIATPKGMKEELRSGTWHTVRYTKRQQKGLTIIWPQEPHTAEVDLT